MRILVLDSTGVATTGSSFSRAFRALGHQVTQLDPTEILNTDVIYRNRVLRRVLERMILDWQAPRILEQLLSVEADMIFVVNGKWALPRLWHDYRAVRPETRLVCYNTDDPITIYSRASNAAWVTEAIGCYDLFATYKDDISDDLVRYGSKAVLILPFAWDPEVLPTAEPNGSEFDILFLANGDAFRQKILIDILSEPHAANLRIGVFGHWKRSGHARLDAIAKPMPYTQEEQSQAMANAIVCLNILRAQNATTHNLRSFEIPGAGGLSLCQHTPQIGKFFPADEAALYFDTPERAVNHVLNMKKNPNLRSRIVARSKEIVAKHTIAHRARELLAAVSEL